MLQIHMSTRLEHYICRKHITAIDHTRVHFHQPNILFIQSSVLPKNEYLQ